MQSMAMADSFEEPDVNSPSHEDRLLADSSLAKREVAVTPDAEEVPAVAAGSKPPEFPFKTPPARSSRAVQSDEEEIFAESSELVSEDPPMKKKNIGFHCQERPPTTSYEKAFKEDCSRDRGGD